MISKRIVTWTLRQTTTAVIALAQIQGAVPNSCRARMQRTRTLVKPGFSNVKDGASGSRNSLTFQTRQANTIAGENVLDPVATTDYKIYESAAQQSRLRVHDPPYFWISDIKKNASQFTCILNNNALVRCTPPGFQVATPSTYDEQEEQSTNTTSINA